MQLQIITAIGTFCWLDDTTLRAGTKKKGLMVIMKRILVSLLFGLLTLSAVQNVSAQQMGIATNTLYWATASPNIALELRTGNRTSVALSVGYNPFKLPNRIASTGIAVNPKLMHWLVSPEWRYWTCRTFERFYVDLHAVGGQYNIGGISLLMPLDGSRYQGWGAGGGIGVGYQWALGKRWGLNLALGVGYVYLHYDRYDCGACGKKTGTFDRHYFGPTQARVSFVFYIG